jgi:hypothetical protein
VPPADPRPAGLPRAVLASCSVTSPHAVMPLPPASAVAAVAAGAAAEEVAAGLAAAETAAEEAAEEVPAGFAPGGAVDVFAAPQLARSRQPAAASRALRVPVPIMMISFAGRGSRP